MKDFITNEDIEEYFIETIDLEKEKDYEICFYDEDYEGFIFTKESIVYKNKIHETEKSLYNEVYFIM